jgi:hypothetical protein
MDNLGGDDFIEIILKGDASVPSSVSSVLLVYCLPAAGWLDPNIVVLWLFGSLLASEQAQF